MGLSLLDFAFEFGDVFADEVEVFVHGFLVEEHDVFDVAVADDDEGVAFFDVEVSA
jgi:hypothetical protein